MLWNNYIIFLCLFRGYQHFWEPRNIRVMFVIEVSMYAEKENPRLWCADGSFGAHFSYLEAQPWVFLAVSSPLPCLYSPFCAVFAIPLSTECLWSMVLTQLQIEEITRYCGMAPTCTSYTLSFLCLSQHGTCLIELESKPWCGVDARGWVVIFFPKTLHTTGDSLKRDIMTTLYWFSAVKGSHVIQWIWKEIGHGPNAYVNHTCLFSEAINVFAAYLTLA